MSIKYDSLDRFLFEDKNVRGELVRLKDSYQSILSSYHYPMPIQKLMGELMAAASLLTATLKFEGEIAMQIQSQGIVNYAVINGSHDQKLRGVARWDETVESLPNDFQDLFEKGYLAITLAPKDGERYQGIVALDKPTLAECLEDYFLQSEQLLTKVQLYTQQDNSALAGGFLLQVVPETSETSQSQENLEFEHLGALAQTLKADEVFALETQDLLHRLYHEEQVRLFEAKSVMFFCDCSKERSSAALHSLSKEDLLAIIAEQGSIKMDCQFCHAKYEYDAVDVENIHHQNIQADGQKH